MRAEILTIGDELCRGEIVDTNSTNLAQRLWDLDITTQWMTSCNDVREDIRLALETAARRADIVVCSGGLGPTEDDLTVDVVSELLDVTAVIHEPARAQMDAWFARTGMQAVSEAHRQVQLRQVRIPTGARAFDNPAGLAPGFEISLRGTPVVCMPGVPREVFAIWDAGLGRRVEALRDQAGDVERVERRIYRAFGRGESDISRACRGIVDDTPGATIHYQVKFPETLVKLVVRDRDRAVAAARLEAMDAGVRSRLGEVVYGTGEATLPEVVVQRLTAVHKTLATAESCTGGLIGELLTAVPGASAAYVGGAITYSNAEKVRQLGVSASSLEEHGAVSEPIAIEMAMGCRERCGTDLAVAVTGVAGPDGGTADKPVGTVWVAVASSSGVATKKLAWPGARDQIRLLSAWWALKMALQAVQ
jgi:nicotinamide-nucleotide amidase